MIQAARPSAPTTLAKNAANWTKSYVETCNLWKANPQDKSLKTAKENAESKYHKKEIQLALSGMFEGKCAYCESHCEHIDYPHIEHFRPKSLYPELCFDWNNLLWGCGKCNGAEHKGDKFPLEAEGGPILNPAEDDPNLHFEFEYDVLTGMVFLNPISQRGSTTLEILGLNERAHLVEHRRFYVKLVYTLAEKGTRENDHHARALVIEACHKSKEYAAFARSIADRFAIDWKT